MANILVTGGNGFIGSHLVDALVVQGHDVIVVDDQSAVSNDTFYFNSGARYYRHDIRDYKAIEWLFDGVNYVFHLAAESRIQTAIQNPNYAYETNVLGTLNIIRACLQHGVKRLVYSSTSAVYKQDDQFPDAKDCGATNENEEILCLNPYAQSKYFGEELCRLYGQTHGLDSVVLRYFNVFGERSPQGGRYAPVIGIFLDQHRNGLPLTVTGNGMQRRDFVHVSDIVQANLLSMSSANVMRGDVFNIGSGRNGSIRYVAQLIANDNIKYIPVRPGEVRHTRANINKANSILGFTPKISVVEWIKEKAHEIDGSIRNPPNGSEDAGIA